MLCDSGTWCFIAGVDIVATQRCQNTSGGLYVTALLQEYFLVSDIKGLEHPF
jgi:hypothetical protein